MPLEQRMRQVYIDLTTPGDVQELIELASLIDPEKANTPLSSEWRAKSDIEDHLLYLSVTNPSWFQPYQKLAAVELADVLPMTVGTAVLLLEGASDHLVEKIAERLKTTPYVRRDLDLLAGIASPYALSILGDHVRAHPDISAPCEPDRPPHRFLGARGSAILTPPLRNAGRPLRSRLHWAGSAGYHGRHHRRLHYLALPESPAERNRRSASVGHTLGCTSSHRGPIGSP